MSTARVSRFVRASPAAVYSALLDPAAVAVWRVPDGMSGQVHELDPREGGRIRVTLTYDDGHAGQGKSASRSDTYAGYFVRLVPDELVVERLAFETGDPALAAPMTMTTSLAPAEGGTVVTVLHEGTPDAVSVADNETGIRMALDHLARLVEGRAPG